MDEILEKYNTLRFQECLNMLKEEIKKEDSLLENLIKQNCIVVCECLVLIFQNESSKADDIVQDLYKVYQNTIAPGLPGTILPIQLELISLFNFIWWSLFYTNVDNTVDIGRSGSLPTIQRGLRRVLGVSCKIKKYTVVTEDILYDLRKAGKQVKIKDYATVCLLAEVIALILLYILKADKSVNVMVQCLETVTTIIEDMEKLIIGLKAVRDFQDPCSFYDKLFKFGFVKINSTLSNITASAIDSLHIIQSLCFLLMKKYENVLLVMKKNLKPAMKPLWCYLGGLSTLMLGDYNQCLGFVVMSEGLTFDGELKSRFNILHGQLLSRKEDYKEALKYFADAKRIAPSIAAPYYYMGEEYGKIGLNDDMVDCFKNAMKVKKESKIHDASPYTNTFESLILGLLHPADEITECEATYAAAVACGLLERYEEAVDIFENYIEVKALEPEGGPLGERIIKTPSLVTILHEAATTNILTGNFSRAQYILSQALNRYTKLEDCIEEPVKDVHVTKDVNWLRNLLREELGLNDAADESKNDSIDLFSEEIVYFFEEDVIGLMLSAEMESKEDEVSFKSKLGKLVSIFWKYLAQFQKKEATREEEREKLRKTLVKALSGKICLNIANYQIKGKTSNCEIERSFKRALNCNQGDKDILYGYCRFLLGDGRVSDAQKLWRTFRGKEPALVVDHLLFRLLTKICNNRTKYLYRLDYNSKLS